MDTTASRVKLANKLKRLKSLKPHKINHDTYYLSYESGYFVARMYDNDNCCTFMAIMEEDTFINNFLNGDDMPTNRVISGSALRRDYDILAPNSVYCFLY